MPFTRDQMLQRVYQGYMSSYDIEQDVHEEGRPELVARAHFHVDEEAYLLSRKAQMYKTTSDEYVWFYSVPHLTDELCRQCIEYAHQQGMPLITPGGTQMVTRLTAVFICDAADEDALATVKKCRIYKSFQFSLKGWMEFHAAAVDLGKESVTANGYGRQTGEFLKKLLHPQSANSKGFRGLLRKLFPRR